MKKTKNFTLAEALITLLIVGIVAVVTIPTLYAKITALVVENQKRVIESKLLQGFNLLNTMEDKFNQRYENTKEFVEALSKYYKVIAICDADELQNCFPYRTIKIQSSDGEKLTADNKNIQELTKPEDFGLSSEEYLNPASFINAQGIPFVILMKRTCVRDSDKAMRSLSEMDCVSGFYDYNGANLPNKFKTSEWKPDGTLDVQTNDIMVFGGINMGCIFTMDDTCVVKSPFFGKLQTRPVSEICSEAGGKIADKNVVAQVASRMYCKNGTCMQFGASGELGGGLSSYKMNTEVAHYLGFRNSPESELSDDLLLFSNYGPDPSKYSQQSFIIGGGDARSMNKDTTYIRYSYFNHRNGQLFCVK